MTENVLVIGATGHLGRHFVRVLREQGMNVLMLIRPAAANALSGERTAVLKPLIGQGAVVHEGNLEDADGLERACDEVDAIVSCVDHRPDHLKLQSALAAAAAKSGRVKRIVPSQFGIDSRLYLEGRVDHGDTKRELQQVFDACGVPVTYVHINGLATYWAASLGQLGLREPPREWIETYGDAGTKFSMVTPEDVARYSVKALFDDRTADRHTLISPLANRLTQSELIATWESMTGARLERRNVSARALDQKIAAVAGQPGKLAELAFLQLIRAAWVDGLGDGRRRPDVLELTELYPDLGFETIARYLERFVATSGVAA